MGMNCKYGISKPGIFKIITLIVGFIAWVLIFAALAKADYFADTYMRHTVQYRYTETICKEQRLRNEEDKDKIGGPKDTAQKAAADAPCPVGELLQTALSFIFFSFIGSCISLVLLLCLELNKNGCFNQLDYVGHWVAGGLNVLGGLLTLTFYLMAMVKFDCSEGSYLHHNAGSSKEKCNANFDVVFMPMELLVATCGCFGNGIVYVITGFVVRKADKEKE